MTDPRTPDNVIAWVLEQGGAYGELEPESPLDEKGQRRALLRPDYGPSTIARVVSVPLDLDR